MSNSTPRILTNVIVSALVLAMIGFGAAFTLLIIKAFSLADTNIGLTFSFTGYAYISIEATFVFLMLYGGYYVFANAVKHPTIEVEVLDE